MGSARCRAVKDGEGLRCYWKRAGSVECGQCREPRGPKLHRLRKERAGPWALSSRSLCQADAHHLCFCDHHHHPSFVHTIKNHLPSIDAGQVSPDICRHPHTRAHPQQATGRDIGNIRRRREHVQNRKTSRRQAERRGRDRRLEAVVGRAD